ncbi:MAG: hypothetical protein OXI56_09230 [bacterium]|nr:hypothetical protein [bacterium]MDE0601958.1 hypothetical protein [bacterium]
MVVKLSDHVEVEWFKQIYGATPDNRLALPARDRTVTDRMAALGMEFLGPRHPSKDPANAENQLDHVFASRGYHESVAVRALNSAEEDEWGASGHCRLLIEVGG